MRDIMYFFFDSKNVIRKGYKEKQNTDTVVKRDVWILAPFLPGASWEKARQMDIVSVVAVAVINSAPTEDWQEEREKPSPPDQ